MEKTQIKKLMEDIYQTNVNNGFYETPVETGTRLMLVTSELAEALEADRHGKRADMVMHDSYINNFFKYAGEEIEAYNKFIKGSFEEEIADAVIRLFDLSEHMGIDLEKHIELKLAYNKTRPFKHGKKY